MAKVLALQEVSANFGTGRQAVAALDGVSLEVGAGEFVVVMGATGSGKSTLLNCAAGLERPAGGVVRLLGRDITGMREAELSRLRRRQVGFVFQSYNLLTELTVAANVLLPVRLGARAARSVGEALTAVGMAGLEHRPVATLSGGQRQRVAVARALVTAPAVIFADEPTGALDPTTAGQVLSLLRRTVDTDGATVVMVSHDPVVAAVSDRLILLRAGRVVGDLPTPATSEIARRLAAVSGAASHTMAGAG